jgi:L-alanine-DL-glutamate epimerase-like enolase superfamily enzyme
MGNWTIEKINLPLKVNWKIARGSLKEKTNMVVTFREGKLEGKGEVAFTTHGEVSVSDVEEAFEEFQNRVPKDINGLENMLEELHKENIPSNLRFALESSYVHFLAELMEDQPSRVLGVREVNNLPTSYSIPHMEVGEVENFFNTHNLSRFPSIKLKVIGADDVALVRKVGELYKGALRIDGNEGFKSSLEVLEFCNHLKDLNIELLEQPLSHKDFDECVKLREKSPFLLIADESLQDGPVVDDFQRAFHGVNIKLQKAGGYFKAMNQMREARALGLKTMLGCMIETSLGISSAMQIAYNVDFLDLDGFLHLKEEPFGLAFEDNGHLFYSFSH